MNARTAHVHLLVMTGRQNVLRLAVFMSARLESIVARLQVRPDEMILEVGCGHGVAADLICQHLGRGQLVAIDRSAKMIAAARQRNARHLAAKRVVFVVAELEAFDPGPLRFDAILAVRVALFHREPERARALVQRWLRPRGRVLAVYDEPANAAASGAPRGRGRR